jgi:hypothetical protein
MQAVHINWANFMYFQNTLTFILQNVGKKENKQSLNAT